ncbi:MAG: ParA family protein [Deltaproteobacteria bacterium]|nr:MAG: ParA family protein [Deltaproteobacteria bacterium]
MSSRGLVFAVANQKGGVAKTTTAVNLAAAFAISERATLLVDVDPQANATSAFGIAPPERHIYHALAGRCVLKDVVQPTELGYLHVVPSGPDLVGAEIELVQLPNRERWLEVALADLRETYEIVLIDCPPSLGLLTVGALTAADAVLIPLQCEYYALEGLARLLDTIRLIRGSLNPALTIEGVVLTMMDARNNLCRQVEQEVRTHLGDQVFQTVIPRNVRLSEAPSHGKPAILYDVQSKGSAAYLKLAAEMLHRLEMSRSTGTPPTLPSNSSGDANGTAT